MSLISVIVAAAIGSVVVLGMTQFQVNLMRSINQVKKGSNLELLAADMVEHLAIKEDCSEQPDPTNIATGTCILKSPCDFLLDGATKSAAIPENAGEEYRDNIRKAFEFPSGNNKDSTDTSISIPAASEATIEYKKPKSYHDLKIVGMKVGKDANADKAKLLVYLSTKKQDILLPDIAPLEITLKIEYKSDDTLKRCYALGSSVEQAALDCITIDDDENEGKTLIGCGGTSDVSANRNTFVGYEVGNKDTTGVNNSFFGYQAGYSNTTNSNSFFGYQAGYSNTIFSNNSFFGYQAGYSNKNNSNTFIGNQAGKYNTTGQFNTFIGNLAGKAGNANKLTGNHNTFIGFATGSLNTTGINNTYIGSFAGFKNTEGYSNAFLGFNAGHWNKGNANTFIGSTAGQGNTEGDSNTFIGVSAGYYNTLGSNNIYIGNHIGSASHSRTRAGISKTANNQLNIGDLILGKRNPTAIPADNSNTPNENKITSITESSGVLIRGSLRCTKEPCGSGGGGATYTYAFHSQTTAYPSCPTGFTELWRGYSSVGGHDAGARANLSEIGSCLENFVVTSWVECAGWTNQCIHNSSGDSTLWLSTLSDTTAATNSSNRNTLMNWVSRCRVCEGSKPIIARHSMTTSYPSCPTGWSELWRGYSYAGGGSNRTPIQHDHLSGPGSCLKNFRKVVTLDCAGKRCFYKSSHDFSSYLATTTANYKNSHQTSATNLISRCRVCMKD